MRLFIPFYTLLNNRDKPRQIANRLDLHNKLTDVHFGPYFAISLHTRDLFSRRLKMNASVLIVDDCKIIPWTVPVCPQTGWIQGPVSRKWAGSSGTTQYISTPMWSSVTIICPRSMALSWSNKWEQIRSTTTFRLLLSLQIIQKSLRR